MRVPPHRAYCPSVSFAPSCGALATRARFPHLGERCRRLVFESRPPAASSSAPWLITERSPFARSVRRATGVSCSNHQALADRLGWGRAAPGHPAAAQVPGARAPARAAAGWVSPGGGVAVPCLLGCLGAVGRVHEVSVGGGRTRRSTLGYADLQMQPQAQICNRRPPIANTHLSIPWAQRSRCRTSIVRVSVRSSPHSAAAFVRGVSGVSTRFLIA